MHHKIVILLFGIVITGMISQAAFGHGLGFETLPPQMLGDRKVSMEVSSTNNNSTHQKQVVFSMFDTTTGITVRDVTYDIRAIKDGKILFEGNYHAGNGVMTIDLIPDKNTDVKAEEKNNAGFFDLLMGSEKSTIEARGNVFEKDGLYKFTVNIVSAERYSSKTQKPVVFESGISFAQSVQYVANDDAYGKQNLKIISYYDILDKESYDSKTRSISFSMPFEWTKDNINQTSVIHQEVFIPKSFSALQVSAYNISVNGFIIPDNAITIDDYSTDYRIIHILLYQVELVDLASKQQNPQNEIIFSLSPKSDDLYLVGTTENIQYKFAITTPQQLIPGQQATIQFQIFDVFLQGKTVSARYDLSIRSGSTEIYKASGTSLDSKDKWNEAKFTLPDDANTIMVSFENVGDNQLAKAEFPLTIPHANEQTLIPSWIKNNAGWWCQKTISDDEFLKGIGYLISKSIIKVDAKYQNSEQKSIPQWVRNNSCWWSDNSISDNEFVSGIAYLVTNGIIKS